MLSRGNGHCLERVAIVLDRHRPSIYSSRPARSPLLGKVEKPRAGGLHLERSVLPIPPSSRDPILNAFAPSVHRSRIQILKHLVPAVIRRNESEPRTG